MLVLLAVLVALLHVWAMQILFRQHDDEPITEAKPLTMAVSMVSIAKPKPAEPPKPVAAPPKPITPPEKKPVPKKPVIKPVEKKPPQKLQQPSDIPTFEPFKPEPAPSVQQTTSSSSATTSTSQATSSAPTKSESFTEANYRANYAHNPKPEYPAIAKSRGWQGKVLLRVQVSAQGTSQSVAIEQSSGREILDEAAMEAVKQWKFVPARRGDTSVASSVIVPIVFTLRD